MDYHKPNTRFPNLLRISDFVVTSRLGQLKNAKSSIVSTLSGMLIEVRLLHSENAKLLIVLTLGGMVMDVRQEQPEYLQPIITQYFIDNKSEIWLLFLIAHSKR